MSSLTHIATFNTNIVENKTLMYINGVCVVMGCYWPVKCLPGIVDAISNRYAYVLKVLCGLNGQPLLCMTSLLIWLLHNLNFRYGRLVTICSDISECR